MTGFVFRAFHIKFCLKVIHQPFVEGMRITRCATDITNYGKLGHNCIPTLVYCDWDNRNRPNWERATEEISEKLAFRSAAAVEMGISGVSHLERFLTGCTEQCCHPNLAHFPLRLEDSWCTDFKNETCEGQLSLPQKAPLRWILPLPLSGIRNQWPPLFRSTIEVTMINIWIVAYLL